MFSKTHFTLTPAYGKDYKSSKAVVEGFEEGKDFIIQPEGQYCSIRDFNVGDTIHLRYNKMERIHVYKYKAVPLVRRTNE